MEAERMCCWDPPTRTGSVLLLTDSRVRETHCSADAWFGGILFTRRLRGLGRDLWVPRQRERESGERGGHNRVRSLWDEFLSCFLSASPCSVSQSLLRLCSSVQEPFLKVMSSTAISPLLPRPRSPFRITWWTAVKWGTLRYSYIGTGT